MKNHEVICSFCDNIQIEKFEYKTTMDCNECHRPSDVYEDGRSEISPLYFAKGDVQRNMEGLGIGKPSLITIDSDDPVKLRKDFLNGKK
jgi:hypothetical protein